MSILVDFIKGIRWTSLSTLLTAVIGIVKLYILLFFLENTDFALFALAAVFVNLGIQLQESGINPAIIQQQEPSVLQLSTLFWLNQGIALLLSLLCWLLSYPLGFWYESAILPHLLQWYSLFFLFNGIGIQYRTLLQYHLAFENLAKIEIASTLLGFAGTIFSPLNPGGVIVWFLEL